MKNIFDQEIKNTQSSVPDFICCPVNLEPFKIPLIITPDGFSYEKYIINELIKRKDYVDPTSRNNFTPDSLVLN